MPEVFELIRGFSRKYNLDPLAVSAVARGEGGLKWGAVGDQGTSFGPFQLHVGGALPRGRGPAFANSAQGVDYALRKMAESGAAGLRGEAAINSIVRNFERPANPNASVANAQRRYGQAGSATSQTGTQMPRTASVGSSFAVDVLGQLARGQFSPSSALGSLAQRKAQRNVLDTNPRVEVRSTGGSLRIPMIRGGSPLAQRVVQTAVSQIGRPYVWGGEDPREGGFDCSGLIDFAYRQAGIDLPGRVTSQSILGLGRSVRSERPQSGDMVVTNGGKHVVMVVGRGKVIAAPHRGARVRFQPIADFAGDIVDIRRVL